MIVLYNISRLYWSSRDNGLLPSFGNPQDCLWTGLYPFFLHLLVIYSLVIVLLCIWAFLLSHQNWLTMSCWMIRRGREIFVCVLWVDYLFAIVVFSCWYWENRRAPSCLLYCIVVLMLTPPVMHQPGKCCTIFPAKSPNVAMAFNVPVGDAPDSEPLNGATRCFSEVSSLSLDWACQLPAASSWWCLTPKMPGSGRSGCGQSRPAVLYVEKTPAWPGWWTMRLSVDLLPQTRLVIRETHGVPHFLRSRPFTEECWFLKVSNVFLKSTWFILKWHF